jgi:hypothetical protein
LIGADAVARATDQRSHRQFLSASTEISATLKLAIQTERDLITSTQSYLIGNPNTSQSQFAKWIADLHVLKRYP